MTDRDFLYGGRTNSVILHFKAEPGIKLHYGDFVCKSILDYVHTITSVHFPIISAMYPSVLVKERYPCGIPEVLCGPELGSDINNYFGVICATVLPPRGLYIPILPYRTKRGSSTKLVFGLCRVSCVIPANSVNRT